MEDTMEVAATVYRRLDSGVCFAQTKRGEGIFIAPRMAELVNAQPGDRLVLVVRDNVPERKHVTPYVAVAIEAEDQGPRTETPAATTPTPAPKPAPAPVAAPEPAPALALEPAPKGEVCGLEDEAFRGRVLEALFLPENKNRVWTGKSMYKELTGEEFTYKLYSEDKARLRRLNMCYTVMLHASQQKKLYCCRIGYNETRSSYMAFARSMEDLMPWGSDEVSDLRNACGV
jgi:hypothetical protein